MELQHPSLGRRSCVARDISEGGVFIQAADLNLKAGAKLKLTVKNTNAVDSRPTPTVDMEVVRVDADGLGCKFVNRSSQHLWESVERLRDELAVGRDYFQLHVCAACLDEQGRLLVVQQSGRWTLPGTYLVVGDEWRASLARLLDGRFSLAVAPSAMTVLALETESNQEIPEAAVAKLFSVMRVDSSRFTFEPGERYRSCRWLQNPRMVDELTFTDALTRTLAAEAFRWLATNEDQA